MSNERKLFVKKFFGFLAVLHCSFALMACKTAGQEETLKPPEPEPTENQWGLTMSVENVTPSGLTIICTQSGVALSDKLITGLYYDELQVYTEEGWVDVPGEEYAQLSVGMTIAANEEQKYEVDWEGFCGKLDSGYYRIGKEYAVLKPGEDTSDTAMMIYAQFQIE